jgi:hypothetical protein
MKRRKRSCRSIMDVDAVIKSKTMKKELIDTS